MSMREVQKSDDAQPLLSPTTTTDKQPVSLERTGCRGVISRMFLSNEHPIFAEHAELSVRGAFFLVVAGLPFLIPEGTTDVLDDLMEKGIFTSGVCIFVVFNLCRTFGETASSTSAGLVGMILAYLNVWIMYGLFPEGYTEDSPIYVKYYGIIHGVLFVWCMLFFKFSISSPIFGVIKFSGPWMAFITVGGDNYKAPWHPEFSIEKDSCSQALIGMVMGMVCTLLVTLLPYPLLSLTKATDHQKHLVHDLPRLLLLLAEHSCGEHANPYYADQVLRRMNRLKDMKDKVPDLLGAAWWETLGFGRRETVRKVVTALDKTINRCYALTQQMWSMCPHHEEPRSQAYVALMQQAEPHILRCIKHIERLLHVCCEATFDGLLSDEEEKNVNSMIKELAELDKELAKVVIKERARLAKDNPSMVFEDLVAPQVICMDITRISKEVTHFAEELKKFKAEPSLIPPADSIGGIASLFQGVCETDNLQFAFTSFVPIMLGFTIGYFGYEDLLHPRKEAIAVSSACLLARFTGSALVADLNRIQGVVLGTVMSNIFHSVFNDCAPWAIAGNAMTLFLFSTAGLFMYFHLVRYAKIGYFMAGFGSSTFLQSCGAKGFDKAAEYEYLITTGVAILLTVAVNALAGHKRASDQAYEAINEAWTILEEALKDIFDPKVETYKFRAKEMQGKLDTALTMNGEADLEPRYWRTEWKVDLFTDVLRFTQDMQRYLTAVERSFASEYVDNTESTKVKYLQDLTTSSQAFVARGDLVRKRVGAGRKLLQIFIHDTTLRFPGLSDADATHEYRPEELKVIEAFKNESDTFAKKVEDETYHSLAEDEQCHLGLVLGILNHINLRLRQTQHKILQAS
eukprot:TRINITY_DN250_c2_g1_i2.p1 TRINITY_DN250_c2_g1~~TRINITY_DN250_c2_g1_i2.p1  ORF type:complete len:856 (-),score=137.58 TRINITY_DN250_c2_g1_i2:198-2765(-)